MGLDIFLCMIYAKPMGRKPLGKERVDITLPKDLKKQLQDAATEDGKTLSDLIADLGREYLPARAVGATIEEQVRHKKFESTDQALNHLLDIFPGILIEIWASTAGMKKRRRRTFGLVIHKPIGYKDSGFDLDAIVRKAAKLARR